MAVKDVVYAPEMVNAALRFKNDQFMARMILPPYPVADEDGIYMKELARIPFTSLTTLARGDFAIAQDIQEGTDSASYQLEGWALRRFISDRERKRAKGGFAQWLKLVGIRLEGLLQLRYEVATAALVFASGNITNNATPGTLWDVGAADILSDFDTARNTDAMLGNLNAGACNKKVYRALRRSESLKELLGYKSATRPKATLLTYDEVKDALELDFLFVSDSKISADGSAFTRIWGDHFLIFAVDPGNSFVTPVLGNSFVLNGANRQTGIKAVKYRDADNRGGGGDWHEVEEMVDPILYAEANTAYLYTSVIS